MKRVGDILLESRLRRLESLIREDITDPKEKIIYLGETGFLSWEEIARECIYWMSLEEAEDMVSELPID